MQIFNKQQFTYITFLFFRNCPQRNVVKKRKQAIHFPLNKDCFYVVVLV